MAANLNVKSVNDVCRLCLAKENLLWVFDKRLTSMKNMKEVVFITTGVEILMKDMISQKICEKCHQISFKMFQFRQQSLKNDKYLKEQFKEMVEASTSKEKPKPKVYPEKQVEKVVEKQVEKPPPAPMKNAANDEPKQPVAPKPAYKIHPSITQLFKVYPQIKLPTVCLQKHIEPFVSMEMDAVENYFKKNNLNFQKCTQLALRYDKKIAMKKTSTKNTTQTTTSVSTKSSNIKNNTKTSVSNDPLRVSSEPVASTSSARSTIERVHPINIKRNQGKDKASYKIVNVSKIIDDKSDKESVKSSDGSRSSSSKKRYGKRKLSDSDLSSEPEIKKPTIMEAVGLTPKKHVNEPGTMYVEKSVALFICSICNSVQYTEKGLKKHQEKHLRCQFCKAKFKTMDAKNQHIQSSCIIKNMMNNLPSILLEKIEKNLPIREAYRSAFKEYPRIPGQKQLNEVPETPEEEDKTVTPSEKSDVIEILSDDESSNVIENETEEKTLKSENNNVTSTTDRTPVVASTASTSTPVSTETPKPHVPTIQEMSISSSVVKPDIKIKNNNFLETIDPKLGDIKVVKELLVKYKNIKLEADCSTQTQLPSSASITVHHGDLTTELKFLKHLLLVYKVPVEIRKGPFNVEYSYQPISKPQKKLDLWNDLVPVDVKCPVIPPVHMPSPNFRLVGGIRNTGPNYSNREKHVLNHQMFVNAPSTNGHSSVPVIPQAHSVSDTVQTTSIIPQASSLTVPQITQGFSNPNVPQITQGFSNPNVPQITQGFSNPNVPQITQGFSNPNVPQITQGFSNPNVPRSLEDSAIGFTNVNKHHNYALNHSGVNQFTQELNNADNNENSTNIATSTVSAVVSEAANVPIAGTIRVKNVWELK